MVLKLSSGLLLCFSVTSAFATDAERILETVQKFRKDVEKIKTYKVEIGCDRTKYERGKKVPEVSHTRIYVSFSDDRDERSEKRTWDKIRTKFVRLEIPRIQTDDSRPSGIGAVTVGSRGWTRKIPEGQFVDSGRSLSHIDVRYFNPLAAGYLTLNDMDYGDDDLIREILSPYEKMSIVSVEPAPLGETIVTWCSGEPDKVGTAYRVITFSPKYNNYPTILQDFYMLRVGEEVRRVGPMSSTEILWTHLNKSLLVPSLVVAETLKRFSKDPFEAGATQVVLDYNWISANKEIPNATFRRESLLDP